MPQIFVHVGVLKFSCMVPRDTRGAKIHTRGVNLYTLFVGKSTAIFATVVGGRIYLFTYYTRVSGQLFYEPDEVRSKFLSRYVKAV